MLWIRTTATQAENKALPTALHCLWNLKVAPINISGPVEISSLCDIALQAIALAPFSQSLRPVHNERRVFVCVFGDW